MVDFAKHLKNPPLKTDPNLLTGHIMARIEPKNHPPRYRECEWEIGPYPSSFGEWTVFRITEGGVTGHESFVLRDDRGLNRYALERIFREPDGEWCACAGGSGWNAMYLPHSELISAIQQWLDREGIKEERNPFHCTKPICNCFVCAQG